MFHLDTLLIINMSSGLTFTWTRFWKEIQLQAFLSLKFAVNKYFQGLPTNRYRFCYFRIISIAKIKVFFQYWYPFTWLIKPVIQIYSLIVNIKSNSWKSNVPALHDALYKILFLLVAVASGCVTRFNKSICSV